MPPSQLKRLKISLREQGVVGPQKPKKQNKQAAKNGALKESRIQRHAALQGIREQFNPFEVKPAGKKKYDFTGSLDGARPAVRRPGVTKGLGEESRRNTLLVDMQRRKKVGGIMDRRFGESDPTLTPEEKALKRFIEEKQRGSKKNAAFDLEDSEEDGQLTHFGQSLSFDKAPPADDFQESELSGSGDQDETDFRPKKKRRLSNGWLDGRSGSEGNNDQSERRKTKKEVMEEVIAKSKLHKYERQQAKEDDDDLRAELDKGLPDMFAALRGNNVKQPTPLRPVVQVNGNASINPDRLALLEGKDRSQADKEYDERVRQMALDQRAKPTAPTLREEEKLERKARRLQELEEQRLRRMRGDSSDIESNPSVDEKVVRGDADKDFDDANAFGLGRGLAGQEQAPQLDVEDEDQFLIDEDLLTDGSNADTQDNDPVHNSGDEDSGSSENEDDEFVTDLLSTVDAGRGGLTISNTVVNKVGTQQRQLPFTYPCPQSHQELLEITKTATAEDLPIIVQRIRALYHPKLGIGNKSKLEIFAAVLVDHISHLAVQSERPPFATLEALIRHIHSLAKAFPEAVGRAFRSHLRNMHNERSLALTSGDLIILTAVGTIFPTSDHFHQVVTPAVLCMARYLSQKLPQSLSELAKGTYICTLCLQFQNISKRYMPEVINYTLNSIAALTPRKAHQSRGVSPCRAMSETIRLDSFHGPRTTRPRSLKFSDTIDTPVSDEEQGFKQALLLANMTLAGNMGELWTTKSAACEILDPLHKALLMLSNKSLADIISPDIRKQAQVTSQKIHILLQNALQARRPLALHNHRPLAIKTSIPKFEESYNPNRHYDPDQERTEISKLKAEHKKERKGALRELRNDASFMAREGLREKKERDLAYETKFKRLVADIQSEEGKEANDYEREKRKRKGKR